MDAPKGCLLPVLQRFQPWLCSAATHTYILGFWYETEIIPRVPKAPLNFCIKFCTIPDFSIAMFGNNWEDLYKTSCGYKDKAYDLLWYVWRFQRSLSNVCKFYPKALPECIYNSHYSNGVPAMLPLSVVQLKGKHYQKVHCRNGVVDTFWLYSIGTLMIHKFLSLGTNARYVK